MRRISEVQRNLGFEAHFRDISLVHFCTSVALTGIARFLRMMPARGVDLRCAE
jgi:hypothetical protein